VTGFIRGLFGSKKKVEEEIIQPKDAFYLPADDAKTFGNIDYMRSSKKTRRTFPKQIVGEDNEFFNEVSATGKVDPKDKPPVDTSPFNGYAAQPAAKPANTASPSPSPSFQPPTKPATDRRQPDTSMDIFRNMARDIKKKS
jgi:hypothetical protein